VPERIRIREGSVSFDVDIMHGQKTGFFLDQSENRIAAAKYARGRALDCFSNTGGFALHFAQSCESVLGIEASSQAVEQAHHNASINGRSNVAFREANVFDFLREAEKNGERFDTVCLDPPAFAKNRAAVSGARAGYKEINLRAMKLLDPDGILVTSSCSYHLSESDFLGLICDAARDSHRYVQVIEKRSQSPDHPVLVSMPETHYLKCLILRLL
jgi:23S rRNA (cytosine1962-C5)-methyltransferase